MIKIKLYVTLFFLISSSFLSQANAQSLSDSDKIRVKQTVQNQLDAFARDDFEAAYSYASPSIKKIFQSYLDFEVMIKNSYQAVYRPKSIDFGVVQSVETGALLKVYLVDPEGAFVTAEYELKKPVSYTHLRAHETDSYVVCRLLLEKKCIRTNLINLIDLLLL